MSQELWTAVDSYIAENLIPYDPVLDAALQANTAAGLSAYDIAPSQGKLIHLLARMQEAKRILEIGTLGGATRVTTASS
jgi:predicted O-methyltransferase YrrM